jgi:thiamine-monophosphate kinase
VSEGEFAIIARLVAALPCRRRDVVTGPGDDAAILRPPPGMDLVHAVDTCLEGVHFPAGLDPADIGWRSLAVNLSDLAAMGAEPAWALLSLSLPRPDEAWLEGFARGMAELACETGLDLVGGDTVRGPLAVTLALTGFVPPGTALRRAGARPGDEVWLTGPLGGGAAGLAAWRMGDRAGASPFLRPRPRLVEGGALRGLASAAIDISDGLAADLGHLLAASEVGATLDLERLPLVRGAAAAGEAAGTRMALFGGDDYQLCFTVPPDRQAELRARAADWPEPPVRIGTVRQEPGLELRRNGKVVVLRGGGWDHFQPDEP